MMKILIRVDISKEPPPSHEVLCENEHGEVLYGYYDNEGRSNCESKYELLRDVTHWYKEAELEGDGFGMVERLQIKYK